jgi:hypothetical protein
LTPESEKRIHIDLEACADSLDTYCPPEYGNMLRASYRELKDEIERLRAERIRGFDLGYLEYPQTLNPS